jgi:hypothetical protein
MGSWTKDQQEPAGERREKAEVSQDRVKLPMKQERGPTRSALERDAFLCGLRALRYREVIGRSDDRVRAWGRALI